MMSRKHIDNKNDDQSISNIESHIDDTETCEATYLMIDSISTQYISNDEHMTDQRESKVSDSKTDDVTETLKTLEIKNSGATHEIDNNQNIQEKTEAFRRVNKRNIGRSNNKTKEVNTFLSQRIPPPFTRWHKTFNKVKDSLDLETFSKTGSLAQHLKEKHAHETYAETLCRITETDNKMLKELNGMMQIKLRYELLNVSMDDFHSYIHGDNEIQCIVCCTTIPDDEADIHKYEVKHMNYVANTIDYRGMRKIDKKFSHCVLCNVKVRGCRKYADAHTRSQQHVQARKLLATPIVK